MLACYHSKLLRSLKSNTGVNGPFPSGPKPLGPIPPDVTGVPAMDPVLLLARIRETMSEHPFLLTSTLALGLLSVKGHTDYMLKCWRGCRCLALYNTEDQT